MTRTLKWLGGGVAAVMLLGLAGLFSGEVAEAQPSGPPHRYAGTVTIDGEAAAAGTSVTAIVNGAECGSATVLESAAGSTYVVDVPDTCADDGDAVSFQVMGYDAAESGTWSGGGRNDIDLTVSTMPAAPSDECPEEGMDMGEGDMGDMPAEPSEPDEPAEPSEPSEPAEPAEPDMGDGTDEGMGEGMDCPEPDDGMGGGDDAPVEPDEPDEPDMGPETDDDDKMGPPDTGTGLATGASTSLAAILGVTALAVMLGGYTFARRRR